MYLQGFKIIHFCRKALLLREQMIFFFKAKPAWKLFNYTFNIIHIPDYYKTSRVLQLCWYQLWFTCCLWLKSWVFKTCFIHASCCGICKYCLAVFFRIMNSTSHSLPDSVMLVKPVFELITRLDNLQHCPKDAMAACLPRKWRKLITMARLHHFYAIITITMSNPRVKVFKRWLNGRIFR